MLTEDQIAFLLHIKNSQNHSWSYLSANHPIGMSWNASKVAKLIEELKSAGMIDQDHATGEITILKPGHDAIDQHRMSLEKQEEISNLNYQKLVADVEKVTSEMADYPETKQRSKDSLTYAKIAVGLSALTLLLQWMCNKPH